MTLLQAAEAALIELKGLHEEVPQDCPGPKHCPTAKAILDLELAIGEENLNFQKLTQVREYIKDELTKTLHINAARLGQSVLAIIDGPKAPEATYPPMTVSDIPTA